MLQFANIDTRKPDGFYVQIARRIEPDAINDAPDERDDGFWPSRDENDAGYVGPCSEEEFAEHQRKANDRMQAWRDGTWAYVGVVAEARCMIVRNGHGILFNIASPGLWGIESDAGDCLDEVFQEQVDEVKGMIDAIRQYAPQYESVDQP